MTAYIIIGISIVALTDIARRLVASGESIRAKIIVDIYKSIRIIAPAAANLRLCFFIK